jgi:hypothetical protein
LKLWIKKRPHSLFTQDLEHNPDGQRRFSP